MRRAIKEAGVNPRWVVLELTETMLIADSDDVVAQPEQEEWVMQEWKKFQGVSS